MAALGIILAIDELLYHCKKRYIPDKCEDELPTENPCPETENQNEV